MFTDGRSVEFKDWVADTSGAILASILYLKWNWYRQILEKHFLSKRESTLARS
jgi:VanZ family protein